MTYISPVLGVRSVKEVNHISRSFCHSVLSARVRSFVRQVIRLQELGMSFMISTGKDKYNKIQNNNEHPKALNTITL